MASAPQVYSVKEYAKLANIHPLTVYKLVTKGDIEAIRIGRSIRIPHREIERLHGIEEPQR